MTNSVLQQVTALQNMDGTELRKMWIQYFQSDPPSNNRGYLVKRLGYRLQELALGGLTPVVEERLKALAAGEGDPKKDTGRKQDSDRPVAGTRLIRQWKGIEHCCTVLEDGFEYEGRKFRSLSAVANFITGTKWNGLLFWGFRRQGSEK
ncbi:MAG: DUF2924 domain-containing protein [Magnetococcales bacterium]|nr:DUF2924 domain-containing protein [Magnetococcales bacterium]